MKNGRIKGDSCGQFTYSSNLDNSVVDYAISNIIPSHFSSLTVKAQSPLSDHSQMNLCIKGENIKSREIHKKPFPLHKLKTPYRWTRNAKNIKSKEKSIEVKLNSQFHNTI